MTGTAWHAKSARRSYVEVRHILIGEALARARAGTLEAHWRTNLLTFAPALVAAATDIAALVEREASELTLQPWEPYAAHGDWREALDAWYSAALALEAEYEEELTAPAPRPTDAQLEWYASSQHLQQEANRGTRESQQRKRDGLGASYRAGLAAGGVEIDWVAWYRERVATWDDLGREELRIDYRRHQADKPYWLTCMQRLPDYWTAGR